MAPTVDVKLKHSQMVQTDVVLNCMHTSQNVAKSMVNDTSQSCDDF